MEDIERIARDLADKYIATYDLDSRYEVYIAGFLDGHVMAQTSLEAERSLRIELQNVLEQVRSKLYLETDRDQATMGMLNLHKPISEVFDKCRNHEERESKP
jgi:hypothetical protein